MSHFYGYIHGNRGEATRCGTKDSGYTAWAQGWEGRISISLWYNETDDVDMFRVCLNSCHGYGSSTVLAEGVLSDGVLLSKPNLVEPIIV